MRNQRCETDGKKYNRPRITKGIPTGSPIDRFGKRIMIASSGAAADALISKVFSVTLSARANATSDPPMVFLTGLFEVYSAIHDSRSDPDLIFR